MIQFLQITFFYQPLDHIITGDQNIISLSICHFNVHLFIGVKVFHYHRTSGLFFKVTDDIFTGILSPVIYIKCLSFKRTGRTAAAHVNKQDNTDSNNRYSHCRNPFASFSDFGLFLSLRSKQRCHIDNDQNCCNDYNHQRGNRIDTGIHTFTHSINHDTQVLYSASCYEIRNNKVIH